MAAGNVGCGKLLQWSIAAVASPFWTGTSDVHSSFIPPQLAVAALLAEMEPPAHREVNM